MTHTLTTKPKQDGFIMPGEFEQHAGCWMLWPERTDVWRGGAKPAQRAYAEVATAIAQFEPLTMGVSASQFRNARNMLPTHIRVVELSADDAWIRDTGPIFVRNHATGEVRGVDFKFNAWGGLLSGLYFPWDKDEQVAHKVLDMERVSRYAAPMILEGGSITVDGEGTLITTEECLLNRNRNPEMSRTEIEQCLQDYLGVKKIIWLKNGMVEDETDGHVDGVCFFARPGVVGLAWTDDPSCIHYDVVRKAWERLNQTKDAQERPLEIHKIPLSDTYFVPASMMADIDVMDDSWPRLGDIELEGNYVNLYIANGGVVVPTYDMPEDKIALDAIQQLFPDRKVVGVPSREIYLGGGMIHCITQQQPA
ncbi:MAG: agmatine deiminase [Chloroflexota bacterium]